MKLTLINKATGEQVSKEDQSTMLNEMFPCRFEGLGLGSDGEPILLSVEGEFAYVDTGKFRVEVEL